MDLRRLRGTRLSFRVGASVLWTAPSVVVSVVPAVIAILTMSSGAWAQARTPSTSPPAASASTTPAPTSTPAPIVPAVGAPAPIVPSVGAPSIAKGASSTQDAGGNPYAASTIASGGLPQGVPPPSEKAADRARELAEAKRFFDAGLKLYKEKLYQEALASFVEAYRISPRESVARNIAQTYRDLKDLASAHVAYEELLNRFGDKMKPKLRDDTRRAIDELAHLTAIVRVRVQDTGARVTLDGKDFGTTPLPKPIRINLGPHRVVVSKSGFETVTKELTVEGREEITVDGSLEKEIVTGHAQVVLRPADPTAKILVDGKEVGTARWEGDLDPGPHAFEAHGTATRAAPKSVDVVKKGKYEVVLDLESQEGTVSVTTGVADAEIAIDGKIMGRGVWEGGVLAGRHELTVSRSGYATQKRAFLVHVGERTVEKVQLAVEVKPPPPPPPTDWSGVYTQFNLVGLFVPGSASNDIAQRRDIPGDADVKSSAGYGGGMQLRVGYSFGFVGLELAALLGYDHTQEDVTFHTQPSAVHPGTASAKVSHVESYQVHRFGGGVGAAVRLMPETQSVRPVLGVGGAVLFKSATYSRSAEDATGNNSYNGTLVSYVAPALLIDGGIELGSTPGTRFYLGMLVQAEFPSGATSDPSILLLPGAGPPKPTKAVDLANGTDLFIGPILGVQFGK